MEKYKFFAHVKKFSLFFFSFRRPIMHVCICVFWQASAFSLYGKSYSALAFKMSHLAYVPEISSSYSFSG